MKKYIFLLTFGVMSLIFSQTTGRLSGQVLKKEFIGDKRYEPLKDAVVSILGTNMKDTTDFEGVYHIFRVEPGVYTVTCEYDNYPKLQRKFVKVKERYLSNLDFDVYPFEIKLDSMHIDYDESYYIMWESQKITGVIKDESGNSISGVIVVVEGTLYGAQTDENGIYQIQLKQGEYSLKCEHKDYQKLTNNLFRISEGKTTIKNFVLQHSEKIDSIECKEIQILRKIENSSQLFI